MLPKVRHKLRRLSPIGRNGHNLPLRAFENCAECPDFRRMDTFWAPIGHFHFYFYSRQPLLGLPAVLTSSGSPACPNTFRRRRHLLIVSTAGWSSVHGTAWMAQHGWHSMDGTAWMAQHGCITWTAWMELHGRFRRVEESLIFSVESQGIS